MRTPRIRLRTLMIAIAATGLILGLVVPINRPRPEVWVYVFGILAVHVFCLGIGLLCLGILHLLGRVR